jgi:hypothetical protein
MSHLIRLATSTAVVGVLLVLVLAGCSRRLPPDESSPASGEVAQLASPAATRAAAEASSPVLPGVTAGPTSALLSPAPTKPPAPAPSSAPPATTAPFVAPDLAAIQRLLDELEAALAADATAATEEGSAP